MTTPIPPTNSSLIAVPITNATVPKEGPKACGVVAPFGSAAPETEFSFNALLTERLKQMSSIQGVYVNNTGNGAAVTFTCSQLNQKVPIPAGACAYIPLLAGDRDTIVISSTGGVDVPVIFYNVPVPAIVWIP